MSFNEQWISRLTDKSGTHVLPILEDMIERENAVIICNFGGDDEDAPINAHLLREHPEQITAGLKLLALISGSTEVILYGGELEIDQLAQDLAEQIAVPVTVKTGPESPVLREASALYSVLDTGVVRADCAAEEYGKEYPSWGYQGRPTLVLDGETVCQAARLSGESDTSITKHVAVIGADTEVKEVPSIIEVPVGSSAELLLGEAVSDLVLLGGTLGSFIKRSELEQTKISFRFESDSIRIFTDVHCAVSETTELYRKIKDLSCGRCVLCREGSWQLNAIFSDMTKGKAGRDDLRLIEDISSLIRVSPLCSFGNNMVLPAMTALTTCAEELTEHVASRKCRKGQCKELLTYAIDPTLCTGCGECPDHCPEDAIEGKAGFIHMIDEDLCIKCGKCILACPEGAIKFGGEKIKVPKRLVKVGKFF